MSRSGYSDDCVDWDLIRWRGAVASAIRGKRGQALLREMRDALDTMPAKELIQHNLVDNAGRVCAIGSVIARRGLDADNIDPDEPEEVADALSVAPAFVKEVAYLNDEHWKPETPAQRWERMRAWVVSQIREETP